MEKLQLNFIDRAIGFFSPSSGLRRLQSRFATREAEKLIRSYESASHGKRTKSWKALSTSASSEIHSALRTLRNRAREMERNNPYVEAAIGKIANNVVGTGIIPTPLIKSKPQEKKLKELWDAWSGKNKSDFDEHLNYYGLQNLVMRTVALSGEAIVRKRVVNDSSLPLPCSCRSWRETSSIHSNWRSLLPAERSCTELNLISSERSWPTGYMSSIPATIFFSTPFPKPQVSCRRHHSRL
jgi:hypothetical protein